MTPKQLTFIRKALDLNQKNLGRLLGMKGKTPDRAIRAWQNEEQEIPGPSSNLLEYLYQGTHRALTQHGLAEHITASQQLKDHQGNTHTQELVIRLKRPRFIADHDSLEVLMWIDQPEGFEIEDLKKEAKDFLQN